MRPQLESLEERLAPAGIPAAQVEVVYLSRQNAGSMDAALAYLAAEQGGRLAASVTLPGWESAAGAEVAVTLGLLLGQIPYLGTGTVLIAVAGPGDGFIPYHELLPVLGGQVPVEVTPGDSAGHPEFPGASYDLAAITQGYFTSDPPAPYGAAPEPVPGIGLVTVDDVTELPPPGPDSQGQLRAPNLYAADLYFSWLLTR